MKNNVLNFHGWLVFTLTLSFVIHNFIVDSSHLLLLYSLNFFIAIFVYWAGFYFKKQTKRIPGILFFSRNTYKVLGFFLYNIAGF